MRPFKILVVLVFLAFLAVPPAYADMLNLSTFTADPGVTQSGGTVTFTESDSPYMDFYFDNSSFFVDPTADSITFNYSFDIGPENDDYLVAVLNYTDYEFVVGGANPSDTNVLTLSGGGEINLTSYRNSAIDLAFGFEANDLLMGSVGTFSNIQINYAGSTAAVPEPSTIFLFGIGLLGIASLGRKKFLRN